MMPFGDELDAADERGGRTGLWRRVVGRTVAVVVMAGLLVVLLLWADYCRAGT